MSKYLRILLWLALVALCAAIIARSKFSADMSAFLPAAPTAAQKLLVDQLRDGLVSRLVLVAIEGGETASLARASQSLALRLKARQDFAAVNNGAEDALVRDGELLLKHRYLLSSAVNAERFSAAGLRDSLERSLESLSSPFGLLTKRVLPHDPTGELMHILGELEAPDRPASQAGVWFSRDAKRALLVLQTKAPGYDIDAQQRALRAIEADFAAVIEADFAAVRSETGAAQLRLRMSGPGVFSVAIREQIKAESTKFSIIATVLVSALLLLTYRSPRVLALGLLPVVSGAVAGIAAVALLHGSVHGITVGFGITLIGEAVDYAVYLFTAVRRGQAPQQGLLRVWPILRLGVLTSVLGFGALMFAGFPGLAQLGLFSVVGLLVAVITTRWVLPDWLPREFQVDAAFGASLQIWVQRAVLLRYPLMLLVAVALVWMLSQARNVWNDELASLTPLSEQDKAFDQQLRQDLGAPDVRYLVLVRGGDEQAVLEAAQLAGERLRELVERGALTGFDSPASALPSERVQRERQRSLPDAETLRRNLAAAVAGLPLQASLFEPFIEDVRQAKAAALLRRAALQGSGLGLKTEALLRGGSDGWVAMLPLRGVREAANIAVALPQATLLDLKHESDSLYRQYRREALALLLWGSLAITLLLVFSLRSVRRVVAVLLPLAAAMIVTIALLLLFGYRLSIFHLVALLLVFGVGSNYTLFFDRHSSAMQDLQRTLVSLALCNLCALIGFGVLAFSSVPVLNAIGMTVGIGAVLSLIFAAIWMPRSASR